MIKYVEMQLLEKNVANSVTFFIFIRVIFVFMRKEKLSLQSDISFLNKEEKNKQTLYRINIKSENI